VDLRFQETQGIEVVLSRMSYRLVDRGTGNVLADETFDRSALEQRFGADASLVPARGTKTFRIAAISEARPSGPLAVQGSVEGLDENEEPVEAAFDLSARLEVNDPGPPSGGACP
jgi:hypothetical protein